MRLVVDMNLSPRWAELLASQGIPAVHWASIGRADAADGEIMRYARSHFAAVLTNDLDFGIHLALTRRSRPSVVQLRFPDLEPNIIGRHITSELHRLAPEIDRGALVTMDEQRTRLRTLPFGKQS